MYWPPITLITLIYFGMGLNISRRVIGCAMEVHRELGNGFLEKVYERALEIEFASKGIRFARQVSFPVSYKGKQIGNFVADMVIERCVILELKASKSITMNDKAQLINYLQASGFSVGLLFNFGQQSL
jgi:GxxExxY protein